jgi:RNA polymerase sigma factor (sigma-70 family)
MGAAGRPDLIARARAGDKAAFEDLLRPVIVPAARFAYGMLHDRAAAEDVVQEAALKAWRRLGNLHAGADFAPWFYGIVANESRSVRRARWWSVLALDRVQQTPGSKPTAAETGEDLRHALMRLPAEQRAALLLHFYLDLSLEDTARSLGISVAGVKSRINRGLKKMRPSLQGYEVPT